MYTRTPCLSSPAVFEESLFRKIDVCYRRKFKLHESKRREANCKVAESRDSARHELERCELETLESMRAIRDKDGFLSLSLSRSLSPVPDKNKSEGN